MISRKNRALDLARRYVLVSDSPTCARRCHRLLTAAPLLMAVELDPRVDHVLWEGDLSSGTIRLNNPLAPDITVSTTVERRGLERRVAALTISDGETTRTITPDDGMIVFVTVALAAIDSALTYGQVTALAAAPDSFDDPEESEVDE